MPRLENPGTGRNMSTQDMEALEAYRFHKQVKDKRQADFDQQLAALTEGNSLVVMDFKANITLGKGPQEDSHVFFKAPQRTVFGVAAYFKRGDVKHKVMFTIVSSVLNHDSKTLREILHRHVLTHSLFNEMQVENVRVWLDNAPNHFRNKETFASFYDLQVELKRNIEINFYAEYHGKSECDRHFGLISRLYTEATGYGRNHDITTTSEFLKMYCDGIRRIGGHVIPNQGHHVDELLPMTKEDSSLNVVAVEFQYEDQDQFLEELLSHRHF